MQINSRRLTLLRWKTTCINMNEIMLNFIVHFDRKYDKLEVSHTSFKKEKYINRA